MKLKNPEEFLRDFCRKEGIRTLDTVTRILPFQGSLFNHSSTFLIRFAKIFKIFGFENLKL